MIKLAIDSHDLSAVLSRFTDAVTERAAAEQRERTMSSRFYDAEDKIRNLKEKLSKYEETPGFPMPIMRTLPSGDEAARKIGLAMKEAKEGNRIAAIKLVRELTGCGLKEAKDAVEIAYPPHVMSSSPQGRW